MRLVGPKSEGLDWSDLVTLVQAVQSFLFRLKVYGVDWSNLTTLMQTGFVSRCVFVVRCSDREWGVDIAVLSCKAAERGTKNLEIRVGSV